ncbi:MAG: S46 family peptidase [Bacteroidota bacterium]|nr:S46 family peptidase [Bacteroidota bacterium]
MKKYFLLWFISVFLFAEEGMYPLSEIHKLNLKSKGFKITAKDIYNPNGISLVDASVNVGGCSASFISAEGLIITNHHCVFGAVQLASTVQNDYVCDGFIARGREQEIPAKGLTARIIDSYRDVSKEVLAGISDTTDPIERIKIIEKNTKALVADAEKKQSGVTASVAEMFTGKTYVLFVHKIIKDIRLVYVPPRSVGEFGGENDNWVWPRHTGDFSFIRAYVSADGSPAEYSPDNVPFKPKNHFKVNPNGVEENDLVFILGYPGRTFRHQTSYYLEYERDIRLPFTQKRNEWMIAQMEAVGKKDPEVALALTARKKSLANVEKNYRGKLKGMNNLPIIQNKQLEEEALQQYINADPVRKQEYGAVLAGIQSVYNEIRSDAQRVNILSNIIGSSTLLTIGNSLMKLADERQKPDAERQSVYKEKNLSALKQNYLSSLRSYNRSIDQLFLQEILNDAASLVNDQPIESVASIKNIRQFVDSAFTGTLLADTSFIAKAFTMTPDQLKQVNDPLIEFARMLLPEIEFQNMINRKRTGELNRLSAKLITVKGLWKKSDFIPDANSTMRMTFGKIRGYSPSDATYFSPITTLNGLIEKSSDDPDYNTPQKIRDLAKKKEYGRYKNKKLNDVPVNILYDMDTTGGNSGSPVLNAKGELIGVNFDRSFEATINDYAWNESYSRSIAVDIRYVLWNVEKVGEADILLKEIGVQ